MARLIAILIVAGVSMCPCQANIKPTRQVEITAEQEKLRDPEGFLAVTELHHLMDDDRSGSIDRSESADFLKEDMKIGGVLDRARREKAFHHNNDEFITVDDLWESWFASEERAWGVDEVAEWLRNVVRLPQYVEHFVSAKVTGMALPRMATQNSSYLLNVLGIKNFVHRQKLQLKALDLVLFGFQDANSRLKDIALAALLILLASVLILFKTHRNRSKRQMAELSSMLSELKNMENDFEGAEQKLDEDRQRHISTTVDSEHIEELKNQLMEANRRIEMNGFDSISLMLQPLLRRTCAIEWSYIASQNENCLNELHNTKDYVDRMHRKQTGLIATLKIATGTTGGTEEIDRRIFSLKSRMEEIKLAINEFHKRWIQIECICGFSIIESSGASINDDMLPKGMKLSMENTCGGMPYSLHDYDASQSTIGDNNSRNSFETMTNGTESLVDGNDATYSAINGQKSSGQRPNLRVFQHSVSQQQLRLQQLQSQQYQAQVVPSDSASGCVQMMYNAESVATAPITCHDNGEAHLKKLKPIHQKSLVTNITSSPTGTIHHSEDSSSLSSSNSKALDLKKSKKLTHFLRRKL